MKVNKIENKKANPTIKKLVIEVFSVFFWTYVFIKLFVFDFDTYLVNKFLPSYIYLLDYKFIFLIGIIAVVWFFTKSKSIMIWTLYLLFFPVIILFWKIPYLIFKKKSWVLAFALINSLISFFISIKYNFIMLAFYLISAVSIFNNSNKIILGVSTGIISVVLLSVYVHRCVSIFKRSSVHHFYMNFISRMENKGFHSFETDKRYRDLPIEDLSVEQLELRTTNLQNLVLFNRMFLFLSKKLQQYQNSRLNLVSNVFSILLVSIFTIFSFSLINYSIFKINSSLFEFIEIPTFFTFFYYSFNNLLSIPINELTPISPFTQSVSMITTFFSFFIVAIFITLLLSVKSEKTVNELNEIILGFGNQGKTLEVFISEEYKINSIEDALIELEKLKAGLTKILYKITESIK